MRFAPEAFRTTRAKTTEHVKAALLATDDLRKLDPETLRANPGSLPTLRMCTAPPLAVDRLVGLANANKSLIGSMEEGGSTQAAQRPNTNGIEPRPLLQIAFAAPSQIRLCETRRSGVSSR